MFIDLSGPRLFLMDKVDEIAFNVRMRGYRFNKHQIITFLTAAAMLSGSESALACDGVMEVDGGLKQNLYALIFAAAETFKSYDLGSLRSMAVLGSSKIKQGKR